MWFKNLQIFNLDEPIAYEPEQLASKLETQAFLPCSKVSQHSIGFFPPMGELETPLVHAANGFMLICIKIQEKVIPPSLLRELIQEKISDIEFREDRRVYSKEKTRIKEEILQDLILRAFCKTKLLYAYIDTQKQWLIVNAASHSNAELFVNTLRNALGNLKISMPEVTSPALYMTEWLKNQTAADGFTIDDFCELRDVDDLGTVRASQQDILSENIQNFLEDGCIVKKLRMEWQEQIKFVLKDDFSLHSIKYLDSVVSQREEVNTESAAERFDADFTIMTQTLQQLLATLFTQFAPIKSKSPAEAAEQSI